MSEPRIRARYLVETAHPLDAVAASIAGEQSTGTFVRVRGETDALRERNGARVERIEACGDVAAPSLPGATAPGGSAKPAWRRAEVTLSWPLRNVGTSLAQLMSTVAGNCYELAPLSGLRLVGLEVPDAYADACPGPAFGVAGTRRLAGVHGRPLIGTIIKPSIGLSPDETAERVRELCEAGIDFIKDDELQADGIDCPFDARVEAVMRVVNDHAQRSGRKVMVAFNLTGDLDDMRRRHDRVLAHGGTCVMLSLISCGLAGLLALRRHAALPIHGHRNGWGALSRAPALGFSAPAWQVFWRLAGIDHIHVNGLRNKFCEDDASVVAAARGCTSPLFAAPRRDFAIMPVFSSGQWAGQVHDTYAALGHVDLIHACGGGIAAHPGGLAAGVRSLREAWSAAMAGVPLEAAAREHPDLATSIATFA